MPPDPGNESCFLNLPLEIRTQIYNFFFHDAFLTFEIHPDSSQGFDRNPPFWILLPKCFSILMTCRTVYHEVQARRFSLQSWHFKGMGALEYFNKYASKKRKQTVRNVSGILLANYRYKTQLCQLPNLRNVKLGPLRAHYPHVRGNAALANSTTSQEEFDNLGWNELVHAINQAGLDWWAPYGLEPLLDRWSEFEVAADFDFDDRGNSRYWIPAILNMKTKSIVRHRDERRNTNMTWLQFRPLSPSPCVLTQFEIAKENPDNVRDRWKSYMTVG